MTIALGSVLLWLLNLAGAALIAGRRRAGWLVALAAQIPWTWHDLRARQPGFLLLRSSACRCRCAGGGQRETWPACRPAWQVAGRPRKRLAPPATRRCSPWLSRSAPGCCPAAILPRPGIPSAGCAVDPSPAGPAPALHPGQPLGRRAAV